MNTDKERTFHYWENEYWYQKMIQVPRELYVQWIHEMFGTPDQDSGTYGWVSETCNYEGYIPTDVDYWYYSWYMDTHCMHVDVYSDPPLWLVMRVIDHIEKQKLNNEN